MNSNKVIILGAGASKSAGVPTIKDFLNEGIILAHENKRNEIEPLNQYWEYMYKTKLVLHPLAWVILSPCRSP